MYVSLSAENSSTGCPEQPNTLMTLDFHPHIHTFSLSLRQRKKGGDRVRKLFQDEMAHLSSRDKGVRDNMWVHWSVLVELCALGMLEINPLKMGRKERSPVLRRSGHSHEMAITCPPSERLLSQVNEWKSKVNEGKQAPGPRVWCVCACACRITVCVTKKKRKKREESFWSLLLLPIGVFECI